MNFILKISKRMAYEIPGEFSHPDLSKIKIF